MPKDCAKQNKKTKKNELSRQTNAAAICVYHVYVYECSLETVWECVCGCVCECVRKLPIYVSIHAYVPFVSICEHVRVRVCCHIIRNVLRQLVCTN